MKVVIEWTILIIALTSTAKSAKITEARSASRNAKDVTKTENIANLQRKSCESHTDVCLTKGCVKAAAAMLDKMDPTADPCSDFYEFSCGGFVKKSPIPEEKSGVTSFTVVNDQLREKMRSIVDHSISEEDSTPIKMVKNLYQSCMNVDAIEKLGGKPIIEILNRMGGWPVLKGDSWDESKFHWEQAVYNNRKEGFSVGSLLNFAVTTDLKNSSWRILWMDQASLGLSREYLIKGLNSSDIKAYLQYTVDIAVLLGADKVRAEKELKESLKLQIDLAKISTPREERRNMTMLYNIYTVKQLSKEIPEIPFLKYINTLLAPNIQIYGNETIGVSDINYLKNLTKLLAKTPKRTIANYMLSRIAETAVPSLSKAFRDAQLKYSSVITGKTKRADRWKECMSTLSSRLPYAVANMYVNNFFDEEAKLQALDIVKYIRGEFDEILNTIEWMDPITRNNALSKAAAIKSYIAYPPEVKQVHKIMEYYGKLVVNNGSLLENLLRSNKFSTNESYSKLREKVDKTDWKRRGRVAIVNAYYSALQNSINFPAGILQDVFFEPDRPKYMNFGGIGYVIGHEITHGFDDQGKQFDENGDLKNWWQPVTEKKFLKKTKCVIEQYGNYTIPENGLKLNGINTQGENIADMGGIKEAYGAYAKWEKVNKQEGVLPGLTEYTNKQLFWISSAQIWCSKYRPEALKVRVLTGVHSPGRFRVKGVLSNTPEFALDWKCPIGSQMNPSNKCNVW